MSLQSAAEHQDDGSSARKNNHYRIVVDTSVLISALYFGGEAEACLRHIANNQRLIVSEYILDELMDFADTTKPKTPQKLKRIIRQTLEKFTREYETREVKIRDVNDIDIMQLALAHDAAIITSDKDILEHFMGAKPPVMTISEYQAIFMK